MDWEKNVRKTLEEDFFPETNSKLRVPLKYLTSKDISDFDYCQQLSLFNMKHPDVGLSEKQIIYRRMNTQFYGPERTDIVEKIIEAIKKGKNPRGKIGLWIEFDGLLILIKQDDLRFYKGRPRLQYKKNRRGKFYQTVYDNEIFSLNLVQYALDQMGFDTSQLISLIVKESSNARESYYLDQYVSSLRSKAKSEKDALEIMQSEEGSDESSAIFPAIYDRDKVETKLTEMISFWTTDQKPKFHGNENKCNACRFYPRGKSFNDEGITCTLYESEVFQRSGKTVIDTKQKGLDDFF